MFKAAVSALLLMLLAGCWSQPVRVGSKASTENRILAEMFAILLEEKGVAVDRLNRLGSTEVVFQGLKNDTIDLYPDYTGTVLSLIGAPRVGDPDEAFSLVSETLASGGLTAFAPLGFTSDYVVLTLPSRARAGGLVRISDLTAVDQDARLGVMQSFAERPRDGLEPFLDRFGLSFAGVQVFPEGDREGLYDALLDGTVDVIVGTSTDPEIADYDLVTLQDQSGFFPVYQAIPLSSQLAVERHPEISEAAAALAGRIDDDLMRQLNAAVRLDGRPVARVARQALYDMGLVATAPRERTPVLGIATEPETTGTEQAIDTLRAVRRAMRGRDVDLMGMDAPLAAVRAQEARLALLPAVSGFSVGEDGLVTRNDDFEAIAAVGSSFLHALSRASDPVIPSQARIIASGPEGSASHVLATIIAAGSTLPDVTVVPLADDSALTAAAALTAGQADVALVFAVPGRDDLRALFSDQDDVVLVDAEDWWGNTARLALPVMREARMPADLYPGMSGPVSTLSTQLILFGPATSDRFVMGQQGPSAFFDELRPLQAQNVLAINETLGMHAAVDPNLRRAAALTPQLTLKDERINPYPGRAVLMAVILLFVVWAAWLFFRPERPQDRS